MSARKPKPVRLSAAELEFIRERNRVLSPQAVQKLGALPPEAVLQRLAPDDQTAVRRQAAAARSRARRTTTRTRGRA